MRDAFDAGKHAIEAGAVRRWRPPGAGDHARGCVTSLLILGLGNDLLGDDGIGLLAAQMLATDDGRVKVAVSSMSGLYLLDAIEGFDDLIVVDSVAGQVPGRIRRLDQRAFPPLAVPSAHYAGLPEALEAARHAGMHVPSRLVILAVEIRDSQVLGSGIGPEVRASLSALLDGVRELAADWGYSVCARNEGTVSPER